MSTLSESSYDYEEKADEFQNGTSEIKRIHEKKDGVLSKREFAKEFRVTKRNKGIKKERNDPFKFQGDGLSFKGKLIGVEMVSSARGDKMCQDALQRLKALVKTSGEHKQRIIFNVSLDGVKIRDDKTADLLYHHPVHKISFISQDNSDARAFGYVYGSPQEQHDFFAIKTEKQASQCVIALRDLFQVIFEMKKKEMEMMKERHEESQVSQGSQTADMSESFVNGEDRSDCNNTTDDSIYYEVKTENGDCLPVELPDLVPPPLPPPRQEPKVTVDDLLGLQTEMESLQLVWDSSIAAMEIATSLPNTGPEADPFDYNILQPVKLDPITNQIISERDNERPASDATDNNSITSSIDESSIIEDSKGADKYAVFECIDEMTTSIFDNPAVVEAPTTVGEDISPEREMPEPTMAAPELPVPPKPPRSPMPDTLIFAELDPLGKDRPFIDKKDFFYTEKNQQKKVLKELAGNGEAVEEQEPLYAKINKVRKDDAAQS